MKVKRWFIKKMVIGMVLPSILFSSSLYYLPIPTEAQAVTIYPVNETDPNNKKSIQEAVEESLNDTGLSLEQEENGTVPEEKIPEEEIPKEAIPMEEIKKDTENLALLIGEGEDTADRFIVKYKDNIGEKLNYREHFAEKLSKVKRINGKKGKNYELVILNQKIKAKEFVEGLDVNEVDDIEYIQPDYQLSILSDDPYFANQWGLENIQPEQAEDNTASPDDDNMRMLERLHRLPPHLREILDSYPQLMEFIMNTPAEELRDKLMAGDFSDDLPSDLLRDLPPHILMELAHDPLFRYEEAVSNESVPAAYACDASVIGAWEKSVGENVIVAVIDTGIGIFHEDLAENIWINTTELPGSDSDDDGNGYVDDIYGWNFYDDNNTVFDNENAADEKHGTHIAGIIAAVKDNGIGIAGTAPKVKIMPLKVFNNSKAYTSDIIAAIEYAEQMGARVVNASWGSAVDNHALKETIENSNMLFVCAAGNNGLDIDISPIYPAAYDCENIISVASVSRNGLLSAFSNYGLSSVDVAAPGEDIFSTVPGNEYVAMNGTSMAAAFVSGEGALLLGMDNSLEAVGLKERIIDSSDRLSSLTEKVLSGNKVNFSNALFEVYNNELIRVEGDSGSSLKPSQWDGYSLFDSSSVGLMNVKQIAASSRHNLALKEDGTIWAWGNNAFGQLGNGTWTDRTMPVQVSGLTGVTAIAAGNLHSLALREDGTVWGWGANYYGHLGDGTTTERKAPVQVSGLTGVTAIAGGSYHSLALKEDGTVWASGANFDGQLGDGTTINRTMPVQVIGLTGVTAITAGRYHSLALKEDGTVWGWGYNYHGQLGDGTTIERTAPVQVSGLTGVTAIAGGSYHSLALKGDGTVWAWGANNYGQLGDGTTTNRTMPVQISGLTGVTAIAARDSQSLALREDGTVWAWGANYNGELGDGIMISRTMPVQVSGLTGVTAIAGGESHSLAVGEDGMVWAWGYNFNGQLGDGTTISKVTPVQVSGLAGVTAIAAGGLHSLALKEDGTIWAWGNNAFGQLGDGTRTNRTIPVQVNGLTGITAIAGGRHHSLAMKEDGTVWAWGYNYFGQLGDGTTTNTTMPVQVIGLTGVTAIAAGERHCLAAREDGTMWAWGYNTDGRLGDGTTTNRTMPVQVIGLTGVTAIAAGTYHSLALKGDGTVWAWGDNYYGQLGDGTAINKITPVQVRRLSGAAVIAAGALHNLAVKEDGTVWGWGANYYGHLGDGTITSRYSPVQVSGLTGITVITGGSHHSLALKGDKTVWAWGTNNNGQIGDPMRVLFSPYPMGIYGSPPHVTAVGTDNELSLSYSIIGGTVYYEIEIDGGTLVNNGKNTTYTYPISTPGHPLTYRVRSINERGPGLWSVNIPSAGSIGTITNRSIEAFWQANGNPAGTLYKLGAFNADNQLVLENDWTSSLSDTLSGLLENTQYKIKIKAKNEDGAETAWSEIGTATTRLMPLLNPALTMTSITGMDYLITASLQNISNFANHEFTVTYDPVMLELLDFAHQTKELNQAIGVINGTNIEIISHADGVIGFKVNKTLPENKVWSGTLTVFKFRALGNGQTTLTIDKIVE